MYPQLLLIEIPLVLGHQTVQLLFELLSFLGLLVELLQQIALHLGRIGMDIVAIMRLFVVFPDVIDDLHVFVVQSFEYFFPLKLQTQCILKYQPNILSTLRQSHQEYRVETILLPDLLLLPRAQFIELFTENRQLWKGFFTFLQHRHNEFFNGPSIFLHLLRKQINYKITILNIFLLIIVLWDRTGLNSAFLINCDVILKSKIQLFCDSFMKKEEEKEQAEFQRVQPVIRIQKKKNLSSVKIEPSCQGEEIGAYEDGRSRKEWDFLQANPILPPNKHHIIEESKLRLSFVNPKDKFARTSFAGTSLRSYHHKHPSFSIHKQQIKETQSPQQEEEQDEENYDEQLNSLLTKGIQIYRRFNNSKLNSLGKEKDRVLCSMFFDWKKEKIKSQQYPLYQHLSSAFKLRHPISEPHWLSFSSEFQSGNLLLAIFKPNESFPTYELYMQNDINTKGCTQWYFFSVGNRGRGKVKFRIMNFYKPTSLYQKGMKVLCSHDRTEWRRTGTSITYGKEGSAFALEFIHEFDAVGRTTYFTYGYPYTYGHNLSNYIDSIFAQPKHLKYLHKTQLCLSTMGNSIPMLTITNFSQKKEPKMLIYVIARQHPGETPASYIVEGLISFLLSCSQEAKELRDKYEFKIVPMMNVDGVISGNYRSNISGSDINRQWQFPSKRGQPEVYYLKQEINGTKRQTAFFLDIHAHSRKMGSFFYGSKAAERDSKLYPFVCSKLNKFISYAQSAFSDDSSKKTTARVVIEQELQVPKSLTFEASFYGWVDPNKGTIFSFKQSDLKAIGESLGMGFYYSLIGIDKVKKAEEVKNTILPKFQSEKQKILFKNSMKILDKWTKQLQKETAEENADLCSEGSSLDPQHFQLKEEQMEFIAQMDLLDQQKKQKSGSRYLSTPKKQQTELEKRMMIYSTIGSPDNHSKLLAPKRGEHQQHLGISSRELHHITHSAKKSNKKLFTVRQLELELQLRENAHPQKKLRGVRLKMPSNSGSMDRYESLDLNRTKNYKQDVWQMKRALKYLIESKSSDYEQYRSFFKSYNSDNQGQLANVFGRNERRINK